MFSAMDALSLFVDEQNVLYTNKNNKSRWCLSWYIFTPQPSGLEGYCRQGQGGRAGGRVAAWLVEPISL